jgi:hypothetical protein
MRVKGVRIALAGALGVALVLAFGCGGGAGTGGDDPTLAFFNGSPDAPNIDFFMDDDLMAADVEYLTKSDWQSTDAQDRDIGALEAGTTTQIDLIFRTLSEDRHYLFPVLGLYNYGSELEKRARLAPAEISRTRPNGSKSGLIIFHGFCREAGFQTPSIDFRNPGNNPQFIAEDIPFAGSAHLLIDSGVHDFVARRNGTEEVYAALDDFNFEAGKIYGVFVVGVENGVGNLAPQIVVREIPAVD